MVTLALVRVCDEAVPEVVVATGVLDATGDAVTGAAVEPDTGEAEPEDVTVDRSVEPLPLAGLYSVVDDVGVAACWAAAEAAAEAAGDVVEEASFWSSALAADDSGVLSEVLAPLADPEDVLASEGVGDALLSVAGELLLAPVGVPVSVGAGDAVLLEAGVVLLDPEAVLVSVGADEALLLAAVELLLDPEAVLVSVGAGEAVLLAAGALLFASDLLPAPAEAGDVVLPALLPAADELLPDPDAVLVSEVAGAVVLFVFPLDDEPPFDAVELLDDEDAGAE